MARFPRHRIGDTSPSLYADLLDFQARADIRVRIRGIVVRIRKRDTAIRVRIVVPAIDHAAYGKLYQAAKLLILGVKNGRALHNEPKRHRNDASEHCAGPVYPVPLTAVELVFEFEA